MDFSQGRGIRRIHCLGIGGAGLSGIAEILHIYGYQITGSDLVANQSTERLTHQYNIPITFQYNESLIATTDLVIYSSAIPFHHPERQLARINQVPCISRGEALGMLTNPRFGIAVAGAHGKTSTVGLIAQLLQQHCLDPTVIIGGYLHHIKSHAAFGKGKYLITEADESDGSLLFLKPQIGIVTQIDQDHLANYNYDFSRLIKAYKQFIKQTQKAAILCCDDPILSQMIPEMDHLEMISYGFDASAMIQGVDFQPLSNGFSLTVIRKLFNLKPLKLIVPLLGQHNAHNVLAAVATATYLKVPDATIQQGLNHYLGVARRLELLGDLALPQGSVTIIDDYGHHPREIVASIKAVREAFCHRRLVLVFQPHRYTRIQALLSEFAEVLAHIADQLLLLPIYAANESSIEGIDHFLLADVIRKKKGSPIVVEPFTLHQTLHKWLKKDDIVLFQGAGNITDIAKNFKATWMNLEENLEQQCL